MAKVMTFWAGEVPLHERACDTRTVVEQKNNRNIILDTKYDKFTGGVRGDQRLFLKDSPCSGCFPILVKQVHRGLPPDERHKRNFRRRVHRLDHPVVGFSFQPLHPCGQKRERREQAPPRLPPACCLFCTCGLYFCIPLPTCA